MLYLHFQQDTKTFGKIGREQQVLFMHQWIQVTVNQDAVINSLNGCCVDNMLAKNIQDAKPVEICKDASNSPTPLVLAEVHHIVRTCGRDIEV